MSVAFLCMLSAHGQAFTNLNFEQAKPVPIIGNPNYPYAVTVASALPAWTVTEAGIEPTIILENDPSLGATAVMLSGPGYYPGFGPIDGNYSAVLQGIAPGTTASISQTGLIPIGTQTLFFDAEPAFGIPFGQLELLIGTQVVPFAIVATEPNYTLYGANISQWAGLTEQLTFSAPGGSDNNWILDDISFSTNSFAPEPGIVVLSAIGGLLFGARKWFPRR